MTRTTPLTKAVNNDNFGIDKKKTKKKRLVCIGYTRVESQQKEMESEVLSKYI